MDGHNRIALHWCRLLQGEERQGRNGTGSHSRYAMGKVIMGGQETNCWHGRKDQGHQLSGDQVWWKYPQMARELQV